MKQSYKIETYIRAAVRSAKSGDDDKTESLIKAAMHDIEELENNPLKTIIRESVRELSVELGAGEQSHAVMHMVNINKGKI